MLQPVGRYFLTHTHTGVLRGGAGPKTQRGCVLGPELPVLETRPGCYHRTPSLSGARGMPKDSVQGASLSSLRWNEASHFPRLGITRVCVFCTPAATRKGDWTLKPVFLRLEFLGTLKLQHIYHLMKEPLYLSDVNLTTALWSFPLYNRKPRRQECK